MKEAHLLIIKHWPEGQAFNLTHTSRNLLEPSSEGRVAAVTFSLCKLQRVSISQKGAFIPFGAVVFTAATQGTPLIPWLWSPAPGSHGTVTVKETVPGSLSPPGHYTESRLKYRQSLWERDVCLSRSFGLGRRLPARLQGPTEGLSGNGGSWTQSFPSPSALPQLTSISQKGPYTFVLDYLIIITLKSRIEWPFSNLKPLCSFPSSTGTLVQVFQHSIRALEWSRFRLPLWYHLSLPASNTSAPAPHTLCHLLSHLPVPSPNHHNLFLECFSSYSLLLPIQPVKYLLTWFPYTVIFFSEPFLGLLQSLAELPTTFIP